MMGINMRKCMRKAFLKVENRFQNKIAYVALCVLCSFVVKKNFPSFENRIKWSFSLTTKEQRTHRAT